MIIYPSMEIEKGRCVSLHRGRTDEPMVWHVDAVAKACEFAAKGAEWLHLTDVDSLSGDDQNSDLKLEIIRQCSLPVQVGGGFRSLEKINEWIELGVGRIVVGTLAVLSPDIVKTAAKLYPDQIVVAVDVWKGNVMIHGWKEPSAITSHALIQAFAQDPLAAFLVTDVDASVDFAESSLELLSSLSAQTRTPCIASGMVTSLSDIERLKQIPNVTGALVGSSLYNKSLELEDALEAARLV